MKCPTCGAPCSVEDNFCRRCGTSMRNSRLPVKRTAKQLPNLWHQATPVVARGAALITAGVVVEWLLRSVTKRALGGAPPKKTLALAKSGDARAPERGQVAIMETVVARRVVVRR